MTDASNYAIGAMLEQPVDSKNLPIVYASHKLKPSEKYSTTKGGLSMSFQLPTLNITC